MIQILKTLFRYKSFTTLNIIGLSTAFAAFIIISMQIRYDVTYNTHVENPESVFVLDSESYNGYNNFTFNRNVPIAVKDAVPEIEYISVTAEFYTNQLKIKISDNDKQTAILERISNIEPDFLHIHDFKFIEGGYSSIDDINNIIVSDKFVEKYFGDKSPIGKQIFSKNKDYVISGVFEALPQNSSVNYNLFKNIGNQNLGHRGNVMYRVWLKLFDGVNNESVEQKMALLNSNKQSIDATGWADDDVPVYGITSIDNVRYLVDEYDINMLYVMIALALAIMILASINFINFATSMAPIKIKGVNLRKVVGATKAELRIGMIGESLTLVVLSLIVAFILVKIFLDSSYSNILSDYSFGANINVYIISFVLSIIIGVISGLYPAFYTTKFKPSMVLNGSYALSVSGRKFRNILICFQFFVTISFIIGAIFIQLQHEYMLKNDGGYEKENVIQIKHGFSFDKYDILKEELSKNPNFKDITFSDMPFGTEEYIVQWGREYSGGFLQIDALSVSYNFLDFFGIKVLNGRDFVSTDDLSENGYFIMSKMAMDKYEIIDGEQIKGHREATSIVGVCENVRMTNMKSLEYPFAFFILGKNPWGNLRIAYVKVKGDSEQSIAFISDAYKKIDPNIVTSISYMTDEFEVAYKEENTFKQIMIGFSTVSIIIALVGVFGLVSFDTRHRRKEIGIRKVNGASINEILSMFSFSYVKFILIGFVVSVPVVYLGVKGWLEQFPYKIDIYWWVFALALLIVFILTMIISIVQSWNAARENPMNVIK